MHLKLKSIGWGAQISSPNHVYKKAKEEFASGFFEGKPRGEINQTQTKPQ